MYARMDSWIIELNGFNLYKNVFTENWIKCNNLSKNGFTNVELNVTNYMRMDLQTTESNTQTYLGTIYIEMSIYAGMFFFFYVFTQKNVLFVLSKSYRKPFLHNLLYWIQW